MPAATPISRRKGRLLKIPFIDNTPLSCFPALPPRCGPAVSADAFGRGWKELVWPDRPTHRVRGRPGLGSSIPYSNGLLKGKTSLCDRGWRWRKPRMDKNAKYGIIYTDFLPPEVCASSFPGKSRAPGGDQNRPSPWTLGAPEAGSAAGSEGFLCLNKTILLTLPGRNAGPGPAAAPASGPETGPAARKRGAAGADWHCG